VIGLLVLDFVLDFRRTAQFIPKGVRLTPLLSGLASTFNALTVLREIPAILLKTRTFKRALGARACQISSLERSRAEEFTRPQ
jgi:hypothetical protein